MKHIIKKSGLLGLALGSLLSGCGPELSSIESNSETTEATESALATFSCSTELSKEKASCVKVREYYCNYDDGRSDCATVAKTWCDSEYSKALASCNAGKVKVYRVLSPDKQHHIETTVPPGTTIAGSPNMFDKFKIEGFAIFSNTAPAASTPSAIRDVIYRCPLNSSPGGVDFQTHSLSCESTGSTPIAKQGFSFTPGTPSTYPVYRCRQLVGGGTWWDHFMSWDVACEGPLFVRDTLIGYAKKS